MTGQFLTGCQSGNHEPDPLTEAFMTIFIPDRDQKKSGLIGADGKTISQNIKITLGICADCQAVYRVKDDDENNNS